jgi:hypothetical protein
MFFCFRPSGGACLERGGEGGANVTAQRVERSVMFTPSPPGTDIASPADLSGPLRSR